MRTDFNMCVDEFIDNELFRTIKLNEEYLNSIELIERIHSIFEIQKKSFKTK